MAKRVQRFPRLAEDYPDAESVGGKPLTLIQRQRLRAARGILPRGYNKLTRKMRRVAKKVVMAGLPVNEACRVTGVDTNTYYRWINLHPKFQAYYRKLVERSVNLVEARLDGKLMRAVRVVEDTMETRDPYLAHEAAVKLLTGRGKYKKHGHNEQETTLNARVLHGGEIKSSGITDKEFLLAFVDRLVQVAQGPPPVQPKIIDAEVVKMLPEPKNESAEVQKG